MPISFSNKIISGSMNKNITPTKEIIAIIIQIARNPYKIPFKIVISKYLLFVVLYA